jgi:hypothetical protein
MAYKVKKKPTYIEEPYGLPKELQEKDKFKEPKEKLSLGGFTGTEAYHQGYMGVQLTDGTYFVGVNNASWLITDICSVLKVEDKVKQEDFVAVKFKVNADNTAEVSYQDGNENVLYTQKYKYTDFNKTFQEKEVMFYYTNNVLMLSQEY